jgi:Tol biopolymer transport system component
VIGSRIGHYEIRAKVGEGGMGEVYRARDTKLDRDVAIKILPAGFASDAERLARFEREARTLASLNHSNIAHIHGVEDTGSSRAIVMELVEGDDLAERLARGPLPLAEALPIARQVAEAIQAAHDLGIVHRDLKPANVKVKPGGAVKLLDFGLAKVCESRLASSSLTQSPTMMSSMPGTLLGTAPYMSPEQVKGHNADARSDVWAFGCLLYEMLTGRPAFAAATASEVVASILTTEPDWSRLPTDTPDAVRRLLRRCLQKDAATRLHAIADARLEIDEALQPNRAVAPARAPLPRVERLAWVSIVAVLALAAAGLYVWATRPVPVPAEVRFDIATPDLAVPPSLTSVSISADGRQILFVADVDGQPHVWIRDIDSVVARPLAGTGGAYNPFWAPDGRSIAFYADGFLKRLDLDGGLVRTLGKALIGVGGSWSRDGVILFVRNPASAIVRVSAEGGESTPATRLEPGHIGHSYPHFLPGGQHFLYYVAAGPDARGIHVGSVDGSTSRRLLDTDGAGVFTKGHLLFVRQRSVFAQAFDTQRLVLEGSPIQVADGVFGRPGESLTLTAGAASFAFRAGDARFERQFTWVDRTGKLIGTLGERLGNPDGVSYSPDLSQLVFFERGPTSSDLWMLDTRRGGMSRFTDDPDEDIFPLWPRDGERIIYTASVKGQHGIYAKHIGTARREMLIPGQSEPIFASDVTPDGQSLVYQLLDPKTGWDVWTLQLGSDAKPTPIIQTDADERVARLSPDGRWLAFVSNNSGTSEVYIQPFPGPGRRLQVSAKGGDQPHWRPDGAEFYYLAPDGKLMATPIKMAADGQSIDIGPPVPLFSANVGLVIFPVLAANYAASPDGQRFLLNQVVRDAGGTPLRVVLNWSGPR